MYGNGCPAARLGEEVFFWWVADILHYYSRGALGQVRARFGVRIRIFCFVFRCASISLPAIEKE